MESPLEMSPEAMRANIVYFNAKRLQLTELAIEAWTEEMKWTQLLANKQHPEAALENMKESP